MRLRLPPGGDRLGPEVGGGPDIHEPGRSRGDPQRPRRRPGRRSRAGRLRLLGGGLRRLPPLAEEGGYEAGAEVPLCRIEAGGGGVLHRLQRGLRDEKRRSALLQRLRAEAGPQLRVRRRHPQVRLGIPRRRCAGDLRGRGPDAGLRLRQRRGACEHPGERGELFGGLQHSQRDEDEPQRALRAREKDHRVGAGAGLFGGEGRGHQGFGGGYKPCREPRIFSEVHYGRGTSRSDPMV